MTLEGNRKRESDDRARERRRSAAAALMLSTASLAGEASAQEGLQKSWKILDEVSSQRADLAQTADRLRQAGVNISGGEFKMDVSRLSADQLRSIAAEKSNLIRTLTDEVETSLKVSHEKQFTLKKSLSRQYIERGKKDDADRIDREIKDMGATRMARLKQVDDARYTAKAAMQDITLALGGLALPNERAASFQKLTERLNAMDEIRKSLEALKGSVQ